MRQLLDPARASLRGTRLWSSPPVAALRRLMKANRPSSEAAIVERPYYKGMTRTQLRALCDTALDQAIVAMREGRYEDVWHAANALDHLRGDQNLRNRNLQQLRLLRVDALALSGRGLQASEALDEVDAYYGASWDTYIRRADLALFTGRYELGLEAVESALLGLPVGADGGKAYQRAALLKVDLLTQQGEYERAREFFLRVFPPNDPRRPLTDRQVSSFRKTIKDVGSLRMLKEYLIPAFGYKGRRAVSGLFHYSIAARDLGYYREALLAIERRFIVGTKVLAPGSKKVPPRVDWSASARQALLDLRTDLSSAKIEFFLISGTLLGCVREGGILGHDKDIDVGVLEGRDPVAIRAALLRTGRFMVLPIISPRLLRVKHINGVMIDIFIHWEEDGRLWHEGQKTRWWNTPFNPIEVDFLGERFLVPDDADLYLTENYGDWRVPVHDFETFCDTPNMVMSNEQELLWYYYRALLDHFYAGKAGQFTRVWSQIKKLSRPGVEMRMAVERAQERLGTKAVGSAEQ